MYSDGDTTPLNADVIKGVDIDGNPFGGIVVRIHEAAAESNLNVLTVTAADPDSPGFGGYQFVHKNDAGVIVFMREQILIATSSVCELVYRAGM